MLIEKKLEIRMQPHEIYAKVRKFCPKSFLLESAEKGRDLARYSFIGFNPERTFTYTEGKAKFNGYETMTEDPFSEMKKIMEKEKTDVRIPGFIGGFVGYISYDFVRTMEKIPQKNPLSPFPMLEFGFFRDGIRIDKETGEITYISLGTNRFEEVRSMLSAPGIVFQPLRLGEKSAALSKEEYMGAVLKAKEYISSGDIFQAVLSNRYEMEFSGDLLPFYFRLREINPSPYMYFLDFGTRKIIGSSPENLIRVENLRVDSYATLAGTRPRGKTETEDRELETELLNDPKERAEHIMLVDLTRNDVGRFAKLGTVCVEEFMKVLKFSHVQHIMSHISAILDSKCDMFDAVKSIFPAGTLSGAPKIRAMEVIDELEPFSRGPYGGAVGYFGLNGNCDFGICIRTILVHGNTIHVQSGAGIVADSIPESEYNETLHKCASSVNALEKCSG